MKILVINAGSSSIKSAIFEGKTNLKKIAEFRIDGIGLKKCKYSFKSENKNLGLRLEVKNHESGIKLLLETLKKTNTIKNYKEINAIGHRVVHGGEKYTNSIIIDAKIIKEIEKISPLAPLHNPANLDAIRACRKILPRVKQVAVFDTAFHQTMPKKAYLYGIPYEFYEKHGIRKYGFHGTSHKYVVNEAIKLLKKLQKKFTHHNLKIISCHLGNGSSITTSINGKSIDTSMGFTPLEGVIMGTRSGSIDPAIIFHLKKTLKIKPEEIENILVNKSGLLGLSRISSDMRDIYQKSLKQDPFALLTIEILSYQIAKYCGAYIAIMGGLDALIFTGGIGENGFYVREKVCEYLEFLGLKLNLKKNREITAPRPLLIPEKISDNKSKITVFVIPTNEELQIAEETKSILASSSLGL